MEFSAAKIAAIIQGQVEGNPDASVSSFAKIEEATEGQLAFLANPKYEEYLYSTNASVVIVNDSLQLRSQIQATLIRVEDAYSAFARLLSAYQDMQKSLLKGVEQPSFVAASATLGKDVYIGAFSYISENAVIGDGAQIYPNTYIGKNVRVGNGTTLFAGVKIYHECIIGDRVIIHAGTVIGSDGFGFAPQKDGSYSKIPQIGSVIVEDDVEIGANTCIDRATMGATVIRKGSKLDNLIQIAHNVEVGSNTVIAAQVGISGSTKIGKNVQIGGQAGLAGHISITDGTRINGQSGVSKSIRAANAAVSGTPAFDHLDYLKTHALSRKLPEFEKKIQELEALVKQFMAEKV